jgi:hypothetical protein
MPQIDLSLYGPLVCTTCGQPACYQGYHEVYPNDLEHPYTILYYVCPQQHYNGSLSTPQTDPYYEEHRWKHGPSNPPPFPGRW